MRPALLLAALTLGGCATAPAPAPEAADAAAPSVSPGMQWLYGSGEGAAASIQTYQAFRDYVLAAARSRPQYSAIMTEAATLARPGFVPCGDKPFAVVLGVDETAQQNLGYEYALAIRGRSADSAMLRRWHETGTDEAAPMPGAVTALQAIRAAGVAVVFISGRDAAYATQTAAQLNRLGLGPVRHGDTLFLRGDTPGDGGKDVRRTLIAQSYCVIAMAGDQLGDFSDLFNERSLSVQERRRFAASAPFASLWGDGWFMLSNPVYGPGLRGAFDDVFPPDKRWSDPAGGND